ncbi:MAG TPA: hypothetical protein PLJ12_11470 [Planctomycetota bacterium]|nr:hypothetical protein [Planctomycetota bacterium]
MYGGLCEAGGVLYVGRHAKSASVTAFDLDGHPIRTIVRFQDAKAGRSAATGLSLDHDHRLWIADGPAGCVRGYTLFGVQVVCLEPATERRDQVGDLGYPVATLALGEDEDMVLVVASGGRRRHAVQVLHTVRGTNLSLRPLRDPEGRFEEVCAIAARGTRELLVLEAAAARIQVFRGGDYHFSIPLHEAGPGARPSCMVVAPDGHVVVGFGGERSSVWVFDDEGRRIACIAEGGREDGQVEDPCALALAPSQGLQPARVFVMDAFGDRVQVFTLQGVCYGAFPALVS